MTDWTTMTDTLQARLQGFWDGLIVSLPNLVAAGLMLLLTWVGVTVARAIIRKLGGKAGLRRNLIDVFAMLAGTGLWLMGVLVALAIIFPSITPGKALTTLGLGSVAIGFAFKDTFENFLAGILILLREPFAIGDHVECDNIEGQIEEITIRDTHVRQTDGQLVVVPNHLLFQNPVRVRTNRDLRRTTIICGVAYGEDVDHAREVITSALRDVDSVRDDVKDVQVFAQEFGASSINFEVTWWTGSEPLAIRTSRDQVVGAVKSALDDAGIEIPFPYRTLTFNEPLPVRDASSDTSSEKAA